MTTIGPRLRARWHRDDVAITSEATDRRTPASVLARRDTPPSIPHHDKVPNNSRGTGVEEAALGAWLDRAMLTR